LRTAKKVVGLGWRGLLALVGGIATLAGCGTQSEIVYGPAIVYCTDDADCSSGWYCDKTLSKPVCDFITWDAGPSVPPPGLDGGLPDSGH
jgi:hypothetical protein